MVGVENQMCEFRFPDYLTQKKSFQIDRMMVQILSGIVFLVLLSFIA